MNQARIVGIGELLWDCFPEWRVPGGAPANVAFHARQLGMDGIVASRVGIDPAGEGLLRHLQSHSLTTQFVQRDSTHLTGAVTVKVEVADRPSFEIHQNVAWDFLEFTPELKTLVEHATAVCYGTLAQRSITSRETIGRVLETAQQTIRVYDVNLRPPWIDRDWVDASLRAANIVKINLEELHSLALMFSLTEDVRGTLDPRLGGALPAGWPLC